MKRILSVVLVMLLCIGLIPNTASAAIKISQKSASVIKGDYLYLSIEGTKKKATWTSSNKRVATVSKTGKVVSISKGKATITAKVDGKKYSCKVTVIPKIDPDYMTDTELEHVLAERNAIEALTSKDSSDATPAKSKPKSKPKTSSSDRNLDGITYSKVEVTIPKSDSEWITSEDLFSEYGYSMVWSSKGMSLIGKSKYLFTGAPSSMSDGAIHECKYNDVTVHMKYNGDYYFNIADLKEIGLIES